MSTLLPIYDTQPVRPAYAQGPQSLAAVRMLRLSVTEGAKVLGITRHTLSRVINGQSGVSPDMAIRLEKAGWSNADHWLRLQTAYELAQARKRQDQIKVDPYEPRPAA